MRTFTYPTKTWSHFAGGLVHFVREHCSAARTRTIRQLVGGSWALHSRGFEVLDEGEEGVDVDGFWDEGEVAGADGALAVFFARVA